MTFILDNLLNPIVALIGSIIVAIVTAMTMRRKTNAEAKKASYEGEASLSAVTLEWAQSIRTELEAQMESVKAANLAEVRGLREQMAERELSSAVQISEMKERLASLESENRIYRRHNAMLIEQLVGAGIKPVTPPLPSRNGG